MELYRITKTIYANDLNGTGGLYSSGRWHREGTPILYLAEHISLAMLETLANSEILSINMSLVTIEIPNDASIKRIQVEDLPQDWRSIPYNEELANITEQWINERIFWMMRVPSAHAPTEFDYLLNPLHPDHKSLKIARIESLVFDRRFK
ncbi:RES domain-containing protein [Larkinella terrae]|uniref:RES domain-containing protein n=2 Tax=Larkinella terrae TaxID=2025311 RepID=A0A7K0EUP4_9BACT|nr:RES domain-containing protein [Larkinella terrae]